MSNKLSFFCFLLVKCVFVSDVAPPFHLLRHTRENLLQKHVQTCLNVRPTFRPSGPDLMDRAGFRFDTGWRDSHVIPFLAP